MLKNIKTKKIYSRFDLDSIPLVPGVYFFKNKDQKILYIGKAKSLKKRVKSYFMKQDFDSKIADLLSESSSIDYITTQTDMEGQLLEAQLIKEHQPIYNTLLKDGNPYLYILFSSVDQKDKKLSEKKLVRQKENLPELKLVRQKKDKGTYFGPFIKKGPVRSVYNYLIRTFRLYRCNLKIENGCLDYHLGICAGTCLNKFDLENYLIRLDLAKQLLNENKSGAKKILKEQIEICKKNREFEKAKNFYNYLQNLELIIETIKLKFNTQKYNNEIFAITNPTPELINQAALTDLKNFLKLKIQPKSIDCFDISHFQGSFIVGSCVRFTNGVVDKTGLRRFKIKTLIQQDDYAALQEIVSRRYKDKFSVPDIILIDGGKGQLNAVKHLVPETTCLSLAKKEEILFSSQHPMGQHLDVKTPMGKLLISIRDYAHHFAISYHKFSRSKNSI